MQIIRHQTDNSNLLTRCISPIPVCLVRLISLHLTVHQSLPPPPPFSLSLSHAHAHERRRVGLCCTVVRSSDSLAASVGLCLRCTALLGSNLVGTISLPKLTCGWMNKDVFYTLSDKELLQLMDKLGQFSHRLLREIQCLAFRHQWVCSFQSWQKQPTRLSQCKHKATKTPGKGGARTWTNPLRECFLGEKQLDVQVAPRRANRYPCRSWNSTPRSPDITKVASSNEIEVRRRKWGISGHLFKSRVELPLTTEVDRAGEGAAAGLNSGTWCTPTTSKRTVSRCCLLTLTWKAPLLNLPGSSASSVLEEEQEC